MQTQWILLRVNSDISLALPLSEVHRILHGADRDFRIHSAAARSLASCLGVLEDPSLPGILAVLANGDVWSAGDSFLPAFGRESSYLAVPGILFPAGRAWCRGILKMAGESAYVTDGALLQALAAPPSEEGHPPSSPRGEEETAPSRPARPVSWFLFRVRDARIGIPADDILGVLQASDPAPLPGAASWVRGYLEYRGILAPVADPRFLAGGGPEARDDILVLVEGPHGVLAIPGAEGSFVRQGDGMPSPEHPGRPAPGGALPGDAGSPGPGPEVRLLTGRALYSLFFLV